MNTLTVGSRAAYAFGPFTLAADGTLLVRDGVPLALPPKVLKTLLVLVERAGHVVTKAALIDAVWPDCVVEEGGLARNISVLRQALGAEGRAYVVTASRVGIASPPPSAEASLRRLDSPGPWRRRQTVPAGRNHPINPDTWPLPGS